MVFGGTPQHGGASNINVFDGFVKKDTLSGYSLFEWIKIDDHQVDRLDAICNRGSFMTWVSSDKEQPAMNFWVQGFYPAVHHFRKSSVRTYINDGKTSL